jgi:hypothetical protein
MVFALVLLLRQTAIEWSGWIDFLGQVVGWNLTQACGRFSAECSINSTFRDTAQTGRLSRLGSKRMGRLQPSCFYDLMSDGMHFPGGIVRGTPNATMHLLPFVPCGWHFEGSAFHEFLDGQDLQARDPVLVRGR